MNTRYRGTKAETDALSAYVKLMRAAESITVRAHAVLPKDTTIAQFGAMEALLHCGPLSQSDLAAKLLKSGGNITLIVDNLEKAGHVVRERSREDRRFITVSLTESGRTYIAELFPKVAASVTRELSTLSSAEQFTLGWLCRKAGKGVASTQSVPAA